MVSEQSGFWRQAREVPGTRSLNVGGNALVRSVSCPTAQNCGAGGQFSGKSGSVPFVVSRRHGAWGTARVVPGLGSLKSPADAWVSSVSCPSAGYCGAGGNYRSGAMVFSRRNGSWGKLRALTADGLIASMSCSSAGNCAGGGYRGLGVNNLYTASLVDEVNGTWGKTHGVPGLGVLNSGHGAEIFSVSCPSAGSCAAGGFYTGAHGQQPFVVNQSNGVWGNATELPGSSSLNAGGHAWITSLSCASPGQCAAGGFYTDRDGRFHALVATQS